MCGLAYEPKDGSRQTGLERQSWPMNGLGEACSSSQRGIYVLERAGGRCSSKYGNSLAASLGTGPLSAIG